MTPKNLRELIEQGYAFPALLPERNDFLLNDSGRELRVKAISEHGVKADLSHLDLSRLDQLRGYTVPLIGHDYTAKTPLMWNSLYEHLGLDVRNIMIVANPRDMAVITQAFRDDPKYLGGGLGVGFKETISYLDRLNPEDIKAANLVVNENGRLVGHNTDAEGFLRSLEDKFFEIGKKLEGSNIVLLGAGGVARQLAYLLASRGVSNLAILNRTIGKALDIAHGVGERYNISAAAGGEDIIRGYVLNSFTRPDAIINTTNKGSDGEFVEYAAFAPANPKLSDGIGFNNTISRTIVSELKRLNPGVVIADINLPKGGKPITLRIAENAGLENLIDGVPMVVNQAAPAYKLVQDAHPDIYTAKVSEEEALDFFRKVA